MAHTRVLHVDFLFFICLPAIFFSRFRLSDGALYFLHLHLWTRRDPKQEMIHEFFYFAKCKLGKTGTDFLSRLLSPPATHIYTLKSTKGWKLEARVDGVKN